jgi:hypothetical protein
VRYAYLQRRRFVLRREFAQPLEKREQGLHMFDRIRTPAALCVVALCASLVDRPLPALADSHIPSIDVIPMLVIDTSGFLASPPGNPLLPAGGELDLNGTVTVPLFDGITFAYDHVTNGLIRNTLPRVATPGVGLTSPGLTYRDYIENFRLDASVLHGVGVEVGSGYRHRVCCPATAQGGTAYHDNYLNLNYTTPAVKELNGATFTYGVTGHQSPHKVSLANGAVPFALAQAAGTTGNETGITQAATLAIPINNGLSVSGTYTWGAFNYFIDAPIPYAYGIWIVNVTKKVDKHLSLGANIDNFEQRSQGYPFGPIGNGGINGASVNIYADIHIGK